MTEAEVIEARRLRRAARSVFETQRELVRADLGAASIGKRIANRLAEDGRFIADEAVETASRHRTALAAAALALTGWLLRKPLMAFAANALGGASEEADDTPEGDAPKDEGQTTEPKV